ncbi:MAG: low molecular weight phosphotyrosine protein phosphatase [Clostridiales bacterium]|nr:low molecular weight phosphotyrosine protein phosphatase [Clostridiales bacterium]
MVRIVFCCHGNICRSPLAQSVFAYLVQQAGLSDDCYIDSMATSTEEIGNPPHWGTVQKLREVGIPLVPHRARKITWRDYERFDFIIGMDEWNMDNLRRILRGDPEEKVHKLLSFAGSRRDIADPWYTGDFDATYADVLEGCTALLEYLRGSGAL